MSKREDMILEASDLGLKFKGNISNVKLAAMISEFKGEPIPVEETPPPGPAVKAEPKEDIASLQSNAQKLANAEHFARRQKIAAAKKKAMKTSIVTLTNKDNRENDVMTTAFLSFENQHFGLAKNVPLDIPVELEAALIDVAKRCKITLHKDEIRGGHRTGNKVPVRVDKYAISYSAQQVT